MSRPTKPGICAFPESRSDDGRRITVGVIAVKTEPVTIIEIPWLKAGIPDIIVGRKLGLHQRTGIAAVRLLARRRIIRIGGIRII
jgi:hypothetical protein